MDTSRIERARLYSSSFRESERRQVIACAVKEKRDNAFSMARRDIGLAAGVVSPALGFVSAYYAVGSEKHFNWYAQNISGLEQGRAGLPLSVGLVTTGGLMISYAYGLRKSLPKSKLYDLGTIALGESGIAFAAAPLFNSSSQPHYYLSGDFFFGFPVALATIGSGMVVNNEKVAGGITLAAAGGAATSVVLGLLTKHPVPAAYEIAQSAFVGTWVAVTGAYLLLKQKFGLESIFKKKNNANRNQQSLGASKAAVQEI